MSAFLSVPSLLLHKIWQRPAAVGQVCVASWRGDNQLAAIKLTRGRADVTWCPLVYCQVNTDAVVVLGSMTNAEFSLGAKSVLPDGMTLGVHNDVVLAGYNGARLPWIPGTDG